MKRALVAAALGGLLLVGTPTLALSAQRNDTRAERGADKGGDKGKGGDKSDRGDRGDKADHRGDRGDRDGRHGHDRGRHRHGHRHGDYYAVRNHLIDFLVTRSKTFRDEMPLGYDPRHPPVVRPTADRPTPAGNGMKRAA